MASLGPGRRLRELLGKNAILLLAALTGFVGALATVAFREALTALQQLLYGRTGSFVEIAAALPWQARLLLPCAGGLMAGAVLAIGRRLPSPRSPDYMEIVAIGDGRVPLRLTLVNSLSSLLSIASGGSLGREGSMVQLAALSASLGGRALGASPIRLRLLVACGAAAGIAAAYNAPIASAFFVTEIVLGAFAMDSLGPIMVAAVVSNITMRHLPGYRPTYEMPDFAPVAGAEMLAFALLGLLAGLVAPAFIGTLQRSRRLFQASGLPLPLRLALGGLGVGAISVWVPQVWGNGYSVVNALLHQDWAWHAVLLVLACKLLATWLSCGSGAVGGIFTPTLFVGATLGYLFALALQAAWPGAGVLPPAYVAVGMGATLAAAASAPLMAILMIFEMTLSYQLMLPLMLACVIAHAVARAADGASMYEITAQRLAEAAERERLRGMRVEELVRPGLTVLPETAPLAAAAELLREHRVNHVYLVDAKNRYRGAVVLHDLAPRLQDPALASLPASSLARLDAIPLLHAGMGLEEGLREFMRHRGERLPIVRAPADPELLGVVYKSDLLDTYVRLNKMPLPPRFDPQDVRHDPATR